MRKLKKQYIEAKSFPPYTVFISMFVIELESSVNEISVKNSFHIINHTVLVLEKLTNVNILKLIMSHGKNNSIIFIIQLSQISISNFYVIMVLYVLTISPRIKNGDIISVFFQSVINIYNFSISNIRTIFFESNT